MTLWILLERNTVGMRRPIKTVPEMQRWWSGVCIGPARTPGEAAGSPQGRSEQDRPSRDLRKCL